MPSWKKFFYTILILLVAGTYLGRTKVEDFFTNYGQKLSDFQDYAENYVAAKIQKNVSTPPPLRAEKESPSPVLSQAGTFRWTNINRRNDGEPALRENQKLDQAALRKVQDMFRNQYFEHISPNGKGPQDLAANVSYDYIAIGENLALGNFASDEELLAAWMASPGHRANILNKGFTEIGVAVMPGRFEGKDTWIAVQEFGSPLSLCPAVDSNLKNEIASNNKKISDLSRQLADQRNTINAMKKNDPALSQKIDDYNSLVKEYNSLVAKTKNLVENYNTGVKLFNDCVKNYSQ